MADLDSQDKRASAVNVLLSAGRVFPNPSGALGPADRGQIAYSYAGSFADDLGGGGGGTEWLYSVFGLRNRRAAPIIGKK